jgi:hypothetical protein
LLVLAFGLQGEAFAQVQKAPLYRYCLLERGGSALDSGGEVTLCRFNTVAQCMASRTSLIDTCIINPELTFPRR